MLISYADRQAILELLAFAEVQHDTDPDFPVVLIKGMDDIVFDGFA